jgi:hypothetical protein
MQGTTRILRTLGCAGFLAQSEGLTIDYYWWVRATLDDGDGFA